MERRKSWNNNDRVVTEKLKAKLLNEAREWIRVFYVVGKEGDLIVKPQLRSGKLGKFVVLKGINGGVSLEETVQLIRTAVKVKENGNEWVVFTEMWQVVKMLEEVDKEIMSNGEWFLEFAEVDEGKHALEAVWRWKLD